MSDRPSSQVPPSSGRNDSDWDDDDWDDDDWDDDAPRRGSGIPVWAAVAAVVAVLAIVGVVVATRDSGDKKGDEAATSTTVAGESVDQCSDWPGIGGLGAPDIVSEAGLHMWSDLDGWHLSRVPGDGVPGLVATVQTNGSDDDLPSQKAVTGGATVDASGAQLKITLPEGATASQADFDIGKYATSVTISMNDPAGTPLPVAAYTTGGGDKASTNPIIATQVMKPCGS